MLKRRGCHTEAGRCVLAFAGAGAARRAAQAQAAAAAGARLPSGPAGILRSRAGLAGDPGPRPHGAASGSTRRRTPRDSPARTWPLPRGRVPQHRRATASTANRRARSPTSWSAAAASSGIGTAAEAEPGSAFFDDLIGARPDPSSPTGATTQTLVAGDRVHPSTRDLPLELNRTDVWYRWQTRPTGTVHTVARWRALADAGRRRHERSAAPTIRSRGAATSAAGGPSTWAWAGPPTAGRRQRLRTHLLGRDPVGHRHGAQQLQGDDQRQLPRHARGERRAGRRPAWPRAASRTGLRSRRTAG